MARIWAVELRCDVIPNTLRVILVVELALEAIGAAGVVMVGFVPRVTRLVDPAALPEASI